MWLRLRQIALVAEELAPAGVDDALTSVLGVEVCFNDPGREDVRARGHAQPIVGGQPVHRGRCPDRGGNGRGPLPRAARRTATAATWSSPSATTTTPAAPGSRRNSVCARSSPSRTRASSATCRSTPRTRAAPSRDRRAGGTGRARSRRSLGAGRSRLEEGQRLDTVDGIVAAELQADDPEALAARWSEIAQIPVTRDAQGRPTVQLENAALRFVPCRDGRPEGLGGLDIHAVDKARALAAADQRGATRHGDTVKPSACASRSSDGCSHAEAARRAEGDDGGDHQAQAAQVQPAPAAPVERCTQRRGQRLRPAGRPTAP